MSGRIRSLVVAASSAIGAASVVLAVLLMPWFVRLGMRVAKAPALERLGEPTAVETAETVRRFVVGRRGRLPTSVGARSGFDRAAVSHLADVRRVVLAVRWIGVVALVGLANLAAHAVAHGTQAELARGLRWGGGALMGFSAIAAAAGLVDFSATFTAFHEVFFPQGGWLFAEDALIIQLFPERFWAVAAGSFVALLALSGAVLVLGARFVRALLQERAGALHDAPVGD